MSATVPVLHPLPDVEANQDRASLYWYGHLLSLSSVLTPRVKGGDSESLSQNIPSHILGDGEGPYWD